VDLRPIAEPLRQIAPRHRGTITVSTASTNSRLSAAATPDRAFPPRQQPRAWRSNAWSMACEPRRTICVFGVHLRLHLRSSLSCPRAPQAWQCEARSTGRNRCAELLVDGAFAISWLAPKGICGRIGRLGNGRQKLSD
jgi:hypothetical protein